MLGPKMKTKNRGILRNSEICPKNFKRQRREKIKISKIRDLCKNTKTPKIEKKTYKKSEKIGKDEKTPSIEDKKKFEEFLENSLNFPAIQNCTAVKAEFVEFGLQAERMRGLSSLPYRHFFSLSENRQKS